MLADRKWGTRRLERSGGPVAESRLARPIRSGALAVAVAAAMVAAVTAVPSALADTGRSRVSASSTVSGAQAVAFLNAQRAANGIPAGITENREWSDGCAKHNRYVELNGTDMSDPHNEDPSKPGYTPEGQAAAQSAVLGGTYDKSGQNPYETAPIHLMQLLGPGLSQTGYAEGCMWTWPGYQRPIPEGVETYSYPGPGASIYRSETAYEWPFVPGDFVGLPEGTKTGPHLYVFAFGGSGWDVDILRAELRGPSGSVPVKFVDNLTSGPKGSIGAYLPRGGIIIPTRPLDPGTRYRAVVDGRIGSEGAWRPIRWDWSFRTKTAPLHVSASSKGRGSRLGVNVNPNWKSGNYRVKIQRKRHGVWRQYRRLLTRGKRDRRTINVPRGRYRVIAPAQRSRTAGKSRVVWVRR